MGSSEDCMAEQALFPLKVLKVLSTFWICEQFSHISSDLYALGTLLFMISRFFCDSTLFLLCSKYFIIFGILFWLGK